MPENTTSTRPIMTRAELAQHEINAHGRDYEKSCDGYEDMELAESEGWSARSNWGRDGWNLGDWPYVALYTRRVGERFQLQQVVEGDHTVYQFDNETDRYAAIDYMFLWYAAGESWAPLSYEDRAKLDAGELTVDEKFRGPCRI